MLKSVSELLCKIIDADDIVGRPGGDEFVVFVKDITSREKLSEICADICNRVHEVKAEDCAITLSAGAVLVYKSQTYGEIYQAADKLLYEAKSNGRDGYACLLYTSIGILLSMLFGLTFFLCAQIDSSKFLSIFSNDSQVIQAGALYLRAYSFDCILVSFVFCMNSYFSGCGNSLFHLIHSLSLIHI